MAVEIVQEDPENIAKGATFLLNDKPLLYAMSDLRGEQVPYFYAEWPLGVTLQEAMGSVRNSYRRLSGKSPYRLYEGGDLGFAEIIVDENPTMVSIEDFLTPTTIKNYTEQSVRDIALVTPYLDYHFQRHQGIFWIAVEGEENMTDAVLDLLKFTSSKIPTSIEEGIIKRNLNRMCKDLPLFVSGR